jgi:hypothetical protein
MTRADGVHSTRRRTASKNNMTNVVRLADHRAPKPTKAAKQKSLYELYPLPFFNRQKRCTWDVKPTGNYGADCETGRAFAIEFLKTCDGTIGWAHVVSMIMVDMIIAGPDGVHGDGSPKTNGIVIGFLGVIGRTLSALTIRHPGGAA